MMFAHPGFSRPPSGRRSGVHEGDEEDEQYGGSSAPASHLTRRTTERAASAPALRRTPYGGAAESSSGGGGSGGGGTMDRICRPQTGTSLRRSSMLDASSSPSSARHGGMGLQRINSAHSISSVSSASSHGSGRPLPVGSHALDVLMNRHVGLNVHVRTVYEKKDEEHERQRKAREAYKKWEEEKRRQAEMEKAKAKKPNMSSRKKEAEKAYEEWLRKKSRAHHEATSHKKEKELDRSDDAYWDNQEMNIRERNGDAKPAPPFNYHPSIVIHDPDHDHHGHNSHHRLSVTGGDGYNISVGATSASGQSINPPAPRAGSTGSLLSSKGQNDRLRKELTDLQDSLDKIKLRD